MLGIIKDPQVLMAAIALTGLEEFALRTTMVSRDKWFRTFSGQQEPAGEERILQARIWAANITMGMYYEFLAIVLSRVAYLAMLPHSESRAQHPINRKKEGETQRCNDYTRPSLRSSPRAWGRIRI